jgi:predicted DNA-binding transcriptional regulator AlpA
LKLMGNNAHDARQHAKHTLYYPYIVTRPMRAHLMNDIPELMNDIDAAKMLKDANVGIGSPTTLRRMRCTGGGPRFVKIGVWVRYRREDVLAYIRERISVPIENTAQAPGYRPSTHRGRRIKSTTEARAS